MNDLLKRIQSLSQAADYKDAEDALQVLEDRFGEDISIKLLEECLKKQKAQLKQILSKDLLDWMNDNDQITFETDDLKVSIKTYVSAKMMDPETGFQWLIDNQYGDLIKDNLEFPKGELTEEAETTLSELGLSYIKKSGIHAQSLKKIMSDRLNDGDLLPDEDMGIKVGYYDECIVKEK